MDLRCPARLQAGKCPWFTHHAATRAPLQDAPCKPGSPIKKKQRLRLQHSATRRWLHSHQFQSPLSGNQEVRGRAHTRGGASPPLVMPAAAGAAE